MSTRERLSELMLRYKVARMARQHGYELRRYDGLAEDDAPYYLVDADRSIMIRDRISLRRAMTWLDDGYHEW